MSLASVIVLALKGAIICAVFAIGLRATLQDATYLLRRPAMLLRALLSMNVVMPIAAILLALAFDLNPAVKIALLALSMSPVPPILPRKAVQAGGEADYTIGLLVAAALFSIVLVPLTLEIFQRAFAVPLQISFGAIVVLIMTTVLLPLLAGIAVHQLAPAFTKRVAKPIALVATVLVLASALPILIMAWPAIKSLIGNGTVVAFILFTLIGLAAGHLLGGPVPENRTGLAFSSSARHPGVAITIASANFPEIRLVLAAVLLYLIVNAIATIPYVRWRRQAGTSPPPLDDLTRSARASDITKKDLHASG